MAVVSIGDALPGRGAAGEVLFDNRTGVRRALEHLHALGHAKSPSFRPPGSPTNDRPAEVYVGTEADRLGLDVRVVSAPYELMRQPCWRATCSTASPRPSALFCFSDSIAYGVYAAARELGLRDPGRPLCDRLRRPSRLDPARAAVDQLLLGHGAPVEMAVGMVLAAIDGAAAPAPTRRDRAGSARARVDGRCPADSTNWRVHRGGFGTFALAEERDELPRHADRVVVRHQKAGAGQGPQLRVGQ